MLGRLSLVGSICACLALPVSAQVGPNIDELARELSNPGAANATLNFKFEYRTYQGTLAGADDQEGLTATFQPVLPFKLNNGNTLILRPSFSFVDNQPVFDPAAGQFSGVSSWGDVPFDMLYSWGRPGWTFGAGLVGSIPTGSEISSENLLLGPSALAVNTRDWGVWGVFPFHNEKISGDGPDTSITSLQYFLFFGLGNGWQIGTGPTMSYDWNAEADQAWTVPLNVQLSKTTAIGTQLVKLNAGIEKNVVSPDAFAQDLKFTFTVSPVIKNPFQRNPPEPGRAVSRSERAALLLPLR